MSFKDAYNLTISQITFMIETIEEYMEKLNDNKTDETIEDMTEEEMFNIFKKI